MSNTKTSQAYLYQDLPVVSPDGTDYTQVLITCLTKAKFAQEAEVAFLDANSNVLASVTYESAGNSENFISAVPIKGHTETTGVTATTFGNFYQLTIPKGATQMMVYFTYLDPPNGNRANPKGKNVAGIETITPVPFGVSTTDFGAETTLYGYAAEDMGNSGVDYQDCQFFMWFGEKLTLS